MTPIEWLYQPPMHTMEKPILSECWEHLKQPITIQQAILTCLLWTGSAFFGCALGYFIIWPTINLFWRFISHGHPLP
jgi:hypothetical protein